MKIRCKFLVHSVTRSLHNGDSLLALPVTEGSEEDKAFHLATPCGKLELSGVKPGVLKFEPGNKVYLDVTIAE